MKLPIEGFETARLNQTLHGRSVYRREDVPGHNVFKGYSTPGTGDALDLFAPAGTRVYPIAPGLTIARWQNDATKKEVVYLEGETAGRRVVAVYAHINFDQRWYVGQSIDQDSSLGRLRSDLADPHLHFELWIDGKAVSAPSSSRLGGDMLDVLVHQPAPADDPAADFVQRWGISDGTRPQDPATRWETWEMLRRYHEQFGPKEG